MSTTPICLQNALDQARRDALVPTVNQNRAGGPFRRRLAIGDPQAPLAQFFAILEAQGLLGRDGRLAPDVQLISLGDHFDWGSRAQRPQAVLEGLQLLAWLAAHPSDQVQLILGNHDLARVGELAAFEPETFARVQAEADVLYYGAGDPEAEHALLKRYPQLPTAEMLARDFACFCPAQGDLVRALLASRRFRIALAEGDDLLLIHAAVCTAHLEAGTPACAPVIAEQLNTRLDAAFAAWLPGTALAIPGLHAPGDAVHGSGRGIFFHRPIYTPELQPQPRPELRRRFDPRLLPIGLTQVIGHTRDGKCRELLAPWVVGPPARPGQLRSLWTDGRDVRYATGLPESGEAGAVLVFADGGMAVSPPAEFELFDLDHRRPFVAGHLCR